MDLALKDIRRHVGKFLATIAGVAMLLSIVLVMNGIYQGNIADGVWLIDNTATDLWVVERGRGGPFNESSRMPLDSYKSVAATPGVAQASPLVIYTAQRPIAGVSRQFTIVGYDVFGGLGGPGRIVAGRSIAAPHYEIVVDQKLGLGLGDRVTLGTHTHTVVGVTRGAVDSAGNPLVYLSLPDAQEVQYQQDNRALVAARAANLKRLERAGYPLDQANCLLPLLSAQNDTVNAVLVRLAPGADAAAVATQIRTWLYFHVYTTEEERSLMLEGRLSKMSAVLGLFRGLLVLVSIVIIALIVYVLTIEKIRSIATLKLIGAPNSVIVHMIMEQSLALTLASFALAYGLRELIAPRFPRTLTFIASETATTFAVMLAGGVIASLMAIWHALRTPPQLAPWEVELPILEVENVSMTFGHGDLAVQALKPTSFRVDGGELAALLGPSGSGKSALLLAISLILAPTTGSIVVAGREVYRDGLTGIDVRGYRRENIGFIFQQHNLIPFLTAAENVALAMQLNGTARRAAARRAKELLGYLEIAHRADSLPANLSGGEQQSVAIGRALASEPRLILADEPTAALDTERGTRVMTLLRQIARERGSAVITVTHDHRMIEGFDTVYHLDDGRLTQVTRAPVVA